MSLLRKFSMPIFLTQEMQMSMLRKFFLEIILRSSYNCTYRVSLQES
jgi:hypothetical protein